MPTLSGSDVRRIAALARLELTDAEVERLTGELAAILDYAAQVQRVDVPADLRIEESTPFEGAPGAPGRLRDDEPMPSLPRAAVLDDAPGANTAAGFFTVPRVLGS
ncbi:MAG TPA: Asp-tRNA(Asn)/Glu-tRNA(Gln) amidotransferase subunit GatC [Vicinamibacterales bacterium]|jgi:aspartyl-tRNA(Asn)/glutamyl-tRNA(Gln) amidotransferase subunit C|nr:Asp-tRNA(Asn)/Glu-tRNA(Gln) amidotransferase subunit GatC [Vicinamibacterales bacterium]